MKWDDIPGYYDWGVYYEDVVNRYPGGLLVEVGCYLGRSLCHLGQLAKASGKPFKVIGVDWCLGSGVEEHGHDHHRDAIVRGGGSFAGELWGNVTRCGLHDVVTLVVAESGRASELFADGSCAMVFLDAAHDYASVHRDIGLWLPKVRPGGELAGDDYGTDLDPQPVWPGVRRAVNELLPHREPVPHDAWKYRVK